MALLIAGTMSLSLAGQAAGIDELVGEDGAVVDVLPGSVEVSGGDKVAAELEVVVVGAEEEPLEDRVLLADKVLGTEDEPSEEELLLAEDVAVENMLLEAESLLSTLTTLVAGP